MIAPARRLQAFFLVQFLSVGMVNAFAGIWFAAIGLSEVQIGLIGAAPIGVMLLLTLAVGRLADRASDWRQVIIIAMLAAGIIPLGLLLSRDFLWVLLVWTGMAAAQRAGVPVADAAALRMARREGLDFGSLRALSTIGYLAVILGAGLLLDRGGVDWFLPLFIGFGLVRAAAALALPRLRAAPPSVTSVSLLRTRPPAWVIWPMLGWAAINTNHAILNSFQGLLWAQQGIALDVIGGLIALGALAEVAMFFAFRRLARRAAPLSILLAAAGFSIIRWVAMAAAPGVAVLVVLQAMHALTYAMGFLAITNFIADSTSEDNAAEAQSLLVVMELAVSVGAVAGFGVLAAAFGAGSYLASAAMAALGGAAILVARGLRPVGAGLDRGAEP